MSGAFDLVLRHVQCGDRRAVDIGIKGGRFTAVAAKLPRCDNDMDGTDTLLHPGLHDHHIHVLATAARNESVDLSGLVSDEAIEAALQTKAATLAPGAWLRATGYDERAGGIPDRHHLDHWIADRPIRIQDRTGALWILNSAAIRQLGAPPYPEAVETDLQGEPKGRIWRGDDWLRQRLGTQPPSLRPLSLALARYGVTAVTDAGANNGPSEAAILCAALGRGSLLQKLTMMGREDLPDHPSYRRGPLKLLYDERDLPDPVVMATRIETARSQARNVAAHCVTEAELVVYLAALELAGGAMEGDRIEHGSMIPAGLIADIAASGLSVAANPGFIARRGDRYLAEVEPHAQPDLQRLRSLAAAGIPMLAGSDAPYGPTNPWIAIAAAIHRKTQSGRTLNASEAVDPQTALSLFQGAGRIEIGAPADCCLIDGNWQEQLATSSTTSQTPNPNPTPIALTLINGTPLYSRGR